MPHNSRAQVATEYLIITGFMLTVVTISFAFAYVSYVQSTTSAQASDALQSIVNGINEVYALGEGNQLLVDIYIPNDCALQSGTGFGIVHKCYDAGEVTGAGDCQGGQGSLCDKSATPGTHDWQCVKSSAITLTCGSNELLYPTMAKIDSPHWPTTSGSFTIKIFWTQSHRVSLRHTGYEEASE